MFFDFTPDGALDFLLFVADVTLKGSLVLALVGLTCMLWRKSSAATRHLLWGLGLSSFALIPLLGWLLPDCHWPAAIAVKDSPRSAAAGPVEPALANLCQLPVNTTDRPPLTWPKVQPPTPKAVLEPIGVPPTAAAMPVTGLDYEPATPALAVSLPLEADLVVVAANLFLLVWLAVFALFAVRLGLGMLSLCRLRRNSRPISAGPMLNTLHERAARLKVRQRLTLVGSNGRTMPMTWGVGRAIVLLPEQARDWTEERLGLVLLHELAHVRRRDCLTQVLAYLVRAVCWFNPLVWWAAARMRVEQERACDDMVLATGARPSTYAEHLLALVATLRVRFLAAPAALGIGRSERLHQRIDQLLSDSVNRRPVGRRGIVVAALASLCLFLALASVGFVAGEAVAEQPILQEQDQPVTDVPATLEKKLAEVHDVIKQNYIKMLDDKKLTAAAIKGILAGLDDPFAEYYDAESYAALQKEFQGQLAGIGIQIKMDKDKELIRVVTPLENSPAFKAGLRPGDVILAVDGKTTKGLSLKDCVQRIIGPVGTKVTLTIQQDDKKKDVELTRALIKLSSVRGFRRDADDNWDYLLDPAQKIGYLQVMQFSSMTTKEITQAIKKMQDQGLKGLILDLRSCPGGLLNQAVSVADLFLPEGTIVTVKHKDKKEQSFQAKKDDDIGDFPLLVLISQNTASAAEILAGTLQDNKRAVLLGSRTYGKGSVHALLPLKDGGALKLTTAWHHLPSGRNIQKKPGEKVWGVDADDGFYLPLSGDQMTILEEKCLERAVLGQKPAPKKLDKVTPEIIEKEFADPQLAAALKTMAARLSDGKFIAVGKTQGALQQTLKQLEQLQKQQQQMQQSLQAIQQQIMEMEGILGKDKK